MAFLVIPNEVDVDRATIWLAAINEQFDPATATLEYGSDQVPVTNQWSDFATADGNNRIRHQRIILTNLFPRTLYNLTFRVGEATAATANVTTLPDRLPVPGQKPFIVLLGSCYFNREDKAGAVGQTYLQLPAGAQPDIKILCGDQVYLDNPFLDFLNPFHGHDWLESRSFKTYADAWTQSNFAGGFQQMLKNGGNFFSSDDHEYWNNAPDVGLNVLAYTATQGRRNTWLGIGRQLYQIFQTSPSPPLMFKVGALSFCNADTRFFRGHGGGTDNFMQPPDLEAIGSWLANLDGPGVLVVGQPIFSDTGSIKDWGLPDFRLQYAQLLQYLRAARHSIVILTGDVHFARVASATLRQDLGTKLVEVISSPMQLVPLGGGEYNAAPNVFGQVMSEPEFSRHRNHFLTVEFTAPSAQRASMVVRFWPIIKNGAPLQSQTIGGPIELI
jgi:phosphodiesterase/alkaline phosphatase D-like protein